MTQKEKDKLKDIFLDQSQYHCNSLEEIRHFYFKHDLDFDSLDMVDFIVAIEREFDIHISIVELDNIRVIGDLLEIMKSKLSQDNYNSNSEVDNNTEFEIQSVKRIADNIIFKLNDVVKLINGSYSFKIKKFSIKNGVFYAHRSKTSQEYQTPLNEIKHLNTNNN